MAMASTPAYWPNKKSRPSMQAVSQLPLSQAPRGFGVCFCCFPAFSARSTCPKTGKLRRLYMLNMAMNREKNIGSSADCAENFLVLSILGVLGLQLTIRTVCDALTQEKRNCSDFWSIIIVYTPNNILWPSLLDIQSILNVGKPFSVHLE